MNKEDRDNARRVAALLRGKAVKVTLVPIYYGGPSYYSQQWRRARGRAREVVLMNNDILSALPSRRHHHGYWVKQGKKLLAQLSIHRSGIGHRVEIQTGISVWFVRAGWKRSST